MASGYEAECLRKLESAYREIRAKIQSAIADLNEWRPAWESLYDALDGDFSDERKRLIHMRTELFQETHKCASAKEQRESWEARLPPPDSGFNQGRAAEYLRENIARLVEEEEARSFRVGILEKEIEEQELIVDERQKDVLPSLSVINHAQSSYDLLSSVEEMLGQEYLNIVRRIPRSIEFVPVEVWSKIFRLAVESQEQCNMDTSSAGLPPEYLESPRQTILSIAGVCREWRRIAFLQGNQTLWDRVVIDASSLTQNSCMAPLIPGGKTFSQSPVHAIIVTQNAENLSQASPPLLRWIRRHNLSDLRVMHKDSSPIRIGSLLRIAADRGHLGSLSIVCQDAEPPETPLTFHVSVFTNLHSLELINTEITLSSFQAEINTLKCLSIRYTRPPAIHRRMPPVLLYQLLSGFPNLEEVEVDLGFEDTPLFGRVNFPPPPYEALRHLRHLTTRFSHFQNRLLFLEHLPLMSLDSITLTTVPSFTSQLTWNPLQKLLRAHGLGQRIQHFEVLDVIPQSRGLFDAGFITSELPNIRTIAFHKQAVDHFLQYLRQTLADNNFPISNVQVISIYDSSIEDTQLLDFCRAHYNAVVNPDQVSTSGGIPGAEGWAQQGSIEVYRCPGISSSALDDINHMLRGYGQSWSMEGPVNSEQGV